MRGLNTVLLQLLIGLILGILCGFYLECSLSVILFCLITGFIFFYGLDRFAKQQRKRFVLSGVLAIFLFFTIGILLARLSYPTIRNDHFLNQPRPEAESSFVLELQERLNPGTSAARFVAEVLEINNRQSSGKVLVTFSKDSVATSMKLRTGTILLGKTTLQTEFPLNYPYQFDYGMYLKIKGIEGQLRLNRDNFFIISEQRSGLTYWAAGIRNFLTEKMNRYSLTPDSRAILLALILGERQDLSPQLRQNYADAGVIHILAVSGLHVGILMLLLQFLLKPLGNYRKSRKIKLIIILGIIWAFATITGFSPSVLRAATMFSFLQIGLVYGQRQAGFNALIASALILLLINVRLLFEVGFQLSYAAVFFILWLYPKIEVLWKPKNRILNYYWKLTGMSLAAQLGVLPLSLYYFHQFPGLFLVANLIILPVLGFILIFGLFILILAGLDLLPQLLVQLFDQILIIMNSFIEFIAEAESLIFKHIYFPAILLITSYLLIFSLGYVLKKRSIVTLRWFLISLSALPISLLTLKLTQTESLYVLNGYRSSHLAEVDRHRNLILHKNNPSPTDLRIEQAFNENLQLKSIYHDSLKHVYDFSKNRLLVIDSLGIYELADLDPTHILLTNSPRINLERLLEYFPQVTIIADSRNYRSYVTRWEATCRKRKIPFHNTYEKGFYKLY